MIFDIAQILINGTMGPPLPQPNTSGIINPQPNPLLNTGNTGTNIYLF